MILENIEHLLRRNINYNLCYENLDVNNVSEIIQADPEPFESEISRIIKNRDENALDDQLDFIEYLTKNKLELYNKDTIRKNIKKIINLIWKNNWEKEDWEDKFIYTDDFKEICRIPIYIPFIFMDLISGIYILYLLHGDKLHLHYKASYQAQNIGESNDEYYKRCNNEELKRKNEHIIKWEEEFNKILSISFDTIFNEATKRGKKRKETVGYQLFEEYGYCVYEINKKFNLPMDLLSMYASEHVNNIWVCVLTPGYEPQYCDGMIVFKTILLHHIKDNLNDRQLLNRIYCASQEIIKKIPDLKTKFETYLADISIKRKLSSPQKDNNYKEKMKQAFVWIKSEIKEIYKNIKDTSEIYLENNLKNNLENNNDEFSDEFNNIYLNIFINLILIEVYAIMLIYKNILLVSVKSHSEIEKLHQFVLINPAYQIGVNSWNDFKNKFKNILDEFFEDDSVKEVKELWFLAIKTIFICDPNRFKLNNKFIIPKKFDDKIISKIGVYHLPARGILATMLLLKHSHDYYVKLKDEEIIVDGNKKRKRIYHGLVSDRISSNKKISLFKILKNWTSESDTPMLKLQVRELTREYISSCKLRDKDLLNMRRVLCLLWIVYLKAIKSSIYNHLKGLNQINITFNLDDIIQKISYKRQQIRDLY